MDLRESFRTLRRRWILTSFMLLLALAAAAAAVIKLPWTYTSESEVVLLASQHASKEVGGNPYLAFDSSLTLTADVVRRELMDPRTGQDLAKRGYTASYVVVDAPDTSGPVLLLTVTGSSKAAVQHTLTGVTSEVSTKLNELQTSIAPQMQIADLTLSMSPQPSLSKSKKARPVAVILGLGLALAFIVPQAVEGRAARLRRQRDTANEPAARRFTAGEPAAGRISRLGQGAESDGAASATARWRSRAR